MVGSIEGKVGNGLSRVAGDLPDEDEGLFVDRIPRTVDLNTVKP